ncbi:Nuclear envelope localization domain [Popillia japonica]|uniref:Nuclear envelope localization domain n=1 Tax=Popillia japonica TaxID=7064 RepID=A0AAW1K1Q5_POPJA
MEDEKPEILKDVEAKVVEDEEPKVVDVEEPKLVEDKEPEKAEEVEQTSISEILEEKVQEPEPPITELQTSISEILEEKVQEPEPPITELEILQEITETKPVTPPQPESPPKILSPSEEFLKAEILAEIQPVTVEATSQTKPVVVTDVHDAIPQAKSPEELEYEILIKTSVILPEDERSSSESSEKKPQPELIEILIKTSVILPEDERSSSESSEKKPQPELISESESSDSEPLVKVTVDGVQVTEADPDKKKKRKRKRRKHKKETPTAPEVESKDSGFLSAFTRRDDTLQEPKELYSEIAKKRSHSPAPLYRPSRGGTIPYKNRKNYIPKSLRSAPIRRHRLNTNRNQWWCQRPDDTYLINVSITIPEDTPSSTPTDLTKEVASVSDLQSPPSSIDDLKSKEKLSSEEFKVEAEPMPSSIDAVDQASEVITAEVVQPQLTSEQATLKEATSSEDVLMEAQINVNITVPREGRIEKEVLTKDSAKFDPNLDLIEHERMIQERPGKKPKTSKHKGKGKHPPSVTIEEVIPVPVTDTPITPGTDISISPPDLRYSSVTTVWDKPVKAAEALEGAVADKPIEHVPIQELNIKWNQTQSMERAKNLQNAKKTTHLSDILYLATLNEVVTDETIEERNSNINKYLSELKVAVDTGDAIIVQRIVVTTVETITSWLDTIEYKIYMNRQQTSEGPSVERVEEMERVEELNNLKAEITNVETNIGNLRTEFNNANNLCNEEDCERIESYIASLQNQVKIIEQVTEEHEQLAVNDLHRWQEFITGVETVATAINELKTQFNNLAQSEASPQIKLNELETLENINNELMIKSVHLVATARSIIRDFSNKEIPQDVYLNLEITKQLEHCIKEERHKSLQLLSIAEEYDQTLKEFAQIMEIADALIDSPIAVNNLEHLEEEMQNHRKAILESLEENLDPETRNNHSELHHNLHKRASVILDQATGRLFPTNVFGSFEMDRFRTGDEGGAQATGRFQLMSLAASKWTVLEQGMREEQKWLQVAQQRVPDLSTVTSADYDQYINLYQSLSLDIANHHTKLVHLANVAHKLQEKITCTGLDQIYVESLDIILRLQEDVSSNLKRLLAFRETWVTYNVLSDKLEYFLRDADIGLTQVEIPLESPTPNPGHMRQFWELKAQTEVHNNIRLEATNTLDKSLQVVAVQDEMVQRKFHADLLDQWQKFTDRVNSLQNTVIGNISAPDAPICRKFNILEQELLELSAMLESLQGIIKTEEELNLYIERLQTMSIRVETIQNELGKLGLLSTMESEKVGNLLSSSKQLELQIHEELDGGYILRDRLQAIDKGLERVRRYHAKFDQTLDQCEGAAKSGSEAVEKAVNECYEVGEGLATVWQDLMSLRQLLHTLPMRLRVSVSPTKVERDISQLQDDHNALEKKCMQILGMLKNRLALWQRFERQLEMVQQSVQEADFMMELLTVQGTVDYDRLLKATERLESVSGDLVNRESLIAELKAVAQPLTESCSPEVSNKVEAAVAEAETAWNETCNNLRELCSKYQHAAELWKQYRDTTDLVREWIDTNIETVNNLDPEEAVKVVNVCEETLAAHTNRLAQLKELVAGIAAAVGLDEQALFGGEVQALGRRLQDVKESLTTLADVAEARAKIRIDTKNGIQDTKTYLDTVQKTLNDIASDNDAEEKLQTLREHLLALTKAKGQIETLNEKTIEVTESVQTDMSVIEVLELWQQIFRETFQQYHRLSTRLVKNEDSIAALKLWEEYLINVQQFLSGGIPDDYHSLSEHRHLCEVHQNLLTTQQNVLLPTEASKLIESNVMEQFNSLTNFHNETLSKIIDRHNEVSDRLRAWSTYREDQNKLLGWLKEMEEDRERLQLRYVHLRRLPKVLMRIQTLLNRVPTGENNLKKLEDQQKHLLEFCDDALATSIRMEYAAIAQRVSNLQAGLDTWKQYLLRIEELHKDYESKVNNLQSYYDEVQSTINSAAHEDLKSNSAVNNKLENLQRMRHRLNDTKKELENLSVIQERLKECASNADMKTINQRMWLLWHQQGDLDHQLQVLCNKLEERRGLRTMFEARQSRFITWTNELENRLEQQNQMSLYGIKDPNELLRKLELEFNAEISLKESEYNWLILTGTELVQACGEEYSDVVAKNNLEARVNQVKDRWEYLDQLGKARVVVAKNNLEARVNQVKDRWEYLDQLGKARVNRIHDMMSTISQLELRIAEIKAWLSQIELQLQTAINFEDTTKETIDKKLQDHDVLRKSIEKESGSIGEVINLCTLLLSDVDSWKAQFTTDYIKSSVQNIEKRWKNEMLKHVDQENWLKEQEERLNRIGEPKSKEDIPELIAIVESVNNEIESKGPIFEILEQSYAKLLQTSGLDTKNILQLTNRVKILIITWLNLKSKPLEILERLRKDLMLYKDFMKSQGLAVIGLSKLDGRLVELDLIKDDQSASSNLDEVMEIEKEFNNLIPTLEEGDKLGLLVMQTSHDSDIDRLQKQIDEYQSLSKTVQKKIKELKSEFHKKIKRKPPRKEVDESVQVSTLAFEEDSAVQVDTLPLLERMTSISAKDAYILQLKTALTETNIHVSNLKDAIERNIPQQQLKTALTETNIHVSNLKDAIERNIPQQYSPELAGLGRKIAKILTACQSSIEQIGHLHNLLIDECQASDEEAKTEEVEALMNEFAVLNEIAKKREGEIREISEAGRLLCPICAQRNWNQLENDLWRLDKWLQAAEGLQSTQHSPPVHIEVLEDVIQDHKQFLLELDSHRSILRSLNIVGTHLIEHSEDTAQAGLFTTRLEDSNKRWNSICQNATTWEVALQKALIDNHQFHTLILDLVAWLSKTEKRIKETEPVDLGVDVEILESQYYRFKEIRTELERCEPRVVSLHEASKALFKNQEIPERFKLKYSQLSELRLKLQSLIKLTGIYILKLGSVLDPNEINSPLVSASSTFGRSLQSMNYDLQDQASATPGPETSHGDKNTGVGTTDEDEHSPRPLRRGYRVLRASLVIQALLLLTLALASLYPYSEDDSSCSLVTNFANSLTPMLRYPDGPPPV